MRIDWRKRERERESAEEGKKKVSEESKMVKEKKVVSSGLVALKKITARHYNGVSENFFIGPIILLV